MSVNSALIEEFRQALIDSDAPPRGKLDVVAALSGPPDLSQDNIISREMTPENLARIALSTRIATKYSVMPKHQHPMLMIGDDEQISLMVQVAHALVGTTLVNWDVRPLSCGSREVGNTKTQMEVLAEWLEGHITLAKKSGLSKPRVILCTSDYHVPRVRRTAVLHLPDWIKFEVVGVHPEGKFTYDVTQKVLGEIKRIRAYIAKGDIAPNPTR